MIICVKTPLAHINLPSDRKSYYNNIRPNYNIYEIHFQFVVKKKKKKKLSRISIGFVCLLGLTLSMLYRKGNCQFWNDSLNIRNVCARITTNHQMPSGENSPVRHITERRRRPQSLICGTGIETRKFSQCQKHKNWTYAKENDLFKKKKMIWFAGIFFVNLFVLGIVNENCW